MIDFIVKLFWFLVNSWTGGYQAEMVLIFVFIPLVILTLLK